MALLLACLGAICFACALVTGKIGLRSLDARAAAAISVPTATALFAIASPFALDLSGFSLPAAALFALVGLFFPALVTLVTFESNDRLGPTVTSTVSSTAPVFALAAAALVLGERITPRALLASVGVAAGIALLSWTPGALRAGSSGRWLVLPLCGALLRGLAQTLAKAGLLLWPNPFAAGLIGYVVSCTVVVAVDRLPRARATPSRAAGAGWFAVTGALNGAGVLAMYGALQTAPVAVVAPIIASYPLITFLLAAIVLREERLTARAAAGSAVTVGAIAFLVAE